MAITLPTASRNTLIDALFDLIDAGTGAGTLLIGTTAMGTTLATLTFSDPAFGAASGGVATASAITSDTSAAATGTAAACRFQDSDSTAVLDGSVTATSGGGDIELSSVSITAGDTVSISSLTGTQPAS